MKSKLIFSLGRKCFWASLLHKSHETQITITSSTPSVVKMLSLNCLRHLASIPHSAANQVSEVCISFRTFPAKMPPKKGKSKAAAATEVVSNSRFKTLKVNERMSIKSFVEKHKLKFATGRGFYQLTKPETIQFHKEIVVRRKSDGTMASGDEVKKISFSFLAYFCVCLCSVENVRLVDGLNKICVIQTKATERFKLIKYFVRIIPCINVGLLSRPSVAKISRF